MNTQNQSHDYRVDGVSKADVTSTEVVFRKQKLSFSTPNTTAIFLDYSYILWFTSQNALIEHKFIKDSGEKTVIQIDSWEKEFEFFHILEQKLGAVIFAYTSLESFSNEFIPENFIYIQKKSNKKFNKTQIERFVSLDVKIGEILPEVMHINSPKGTAIWESYRYLKELRDSIVHLKTINKAKSTSIWQNLLDDKVLNPCLEAKNIIGYFLSVKPMDQQPLWFKNFYKMEKETSKRFYELANIH